MYAYLYGERERERDLLDVEYEAFVSKFVSKLVSHVEHCIACNKKQIHMNKAKARHRIVVADSKLYFLIFCTGSSSNRLN